MPNQKGSLTFALIPVFIFIGLSVYLIGVNPALRADIVRTIHPSILAPTPYPNVATASATFADLLDESPAPIISAYNLPISHDSTKSSTIFSTPPSTPKPSIVPASSYSASLDNNKVIINGTYSLNTFSKIKYSVSFPITGGDIKGKIEGSCVADLVGYFETPNINGEGKINGTINGECYPIPLLPIKTEVKSTFDGMAHLKTGTVDVNYAASQPVNLKGAFSFFFKP